MNPVLLDNLEHADLAIRGDRGAAFGDPSGFVEVVPGEFENLQREYCVLYRRGPDGGARSVALLGLTPDANVFISGNRWDARYEPALVRRAGFLIAELQDDRQALQVDLDHPRICKNGQGRPLFLPQGGHAAPLASAIEALQVIREGRADAEKLSQLLDEFELLERLDLEIGPVDDQTFRLSGFESIDPARLSELSIEALDRLRSEGLLAAVIFAAHSLGNLGHLVERHQAKHARR